MGLFEMLKSSVGSKKSNNSGGTTTISAKERLKASIILGAVGDAIGMLFQGMCANRWLK